MPIAQSPQVRNCVELLSNSGITVCRSKDSADKPWHPSICCYNVTMSDSTKTNQTPVLETVEPIGKRVLIRKDEDKKTTKTGIHLPDKIEIPTLTGRVVAVSAQVGNDPDYPVEQYDRVLFNPKEAIPVDFEGDNRLFVVPVENIVAVFRKAG